MAAGSLGIALVVSACTISSTVPGQLAKNQQILASCDKIPPASDIQVDGSGSSNSKPLLEERMTAIEGIVRRTTICFGRLRVSVFSASSAGAVTLFDGPLPLYGATDNARLRRVPHVVGDAMAKIRTTYAPGVAALKGGGSDITAQYRLAKEWIDQVGFSFRLHLYLFTDGFQNVGVKVGGRELDPREATTLANRTAVPKLPSAAITVAGLGRVAGKPPHSVVVEGLTFYYDALCHRTGATKCMSVTTYAQTSR